MEAGLVENCGRFDRVVPAGCYCLLCPVENLVSRVSLRIQYLDVTCDTKTKDNVFVKVVVAGECDLLSRGLVLHSLTHSMVCLFALTAR
jgi:hypothetical protein